MDYTGCSAQKGYFFRLKGYMKIKINSWNLMSGGIEFVVGIKKGYHFLCDYSI